MKRRTTLLTAVLGIILFFLTGVMLAPLPAAATGAAARSGTHSVLSSHTSHTSHTASSGKGTSTKKGSTVPNRFFSQLTIKNIKIKKCLLTITLSNVGSGPVSRDSYAKGTLSVSFNRALASSKGTKSFIPKSYTVKLGKADPRHLLSRHKDLEINTHIRITSPVALQARLTNLTLDTGKGTLTYSKALVPSSSCLPKVSRRGPALAGAKGSSAKVRKSGSTPPGGGHGVQPLPGRKIYPPALSIERAYVDERDHHLHIVLVNKGKGPVSREDLLRSTLVISVKRDRKREPRVSVSVDTRHASTRKSAYQGTSHKYPSHMSIRLVSVCSPASFHHGGEADIRTRLVLNSPVIVHIELRRSSRDSRKEKARLTYYYPPLQGTPMVALKEKGGKGSPAVESKVLVTPRLKGVHKGGKPMASKRALATPATQAPTGGKMVKKVSPSMGVTPKGKNLRTMESQPAGRPYLAFFLNERELLLDNQGKVSVFDRNTDTYPYRFSWALLNAASARDGVKNFVAGIDVYDSASREWRPYRRIERSNGLPNSFKFTIRDIDRFLRDQGMTAGPIYRIAINARATYDANLTAGHMAAASESSPAVLGGRHTNKATVFECHLVINFYKETSANQDNRPDPDAFPPSPPSNMDERTAGMELPDMLRKRGDNVVISSENRIRYLRGAFPFIQEGERKVEGYSICNAYYCWALPGGESDSAPLIWTLSIRDLFNGGRCIITGSERNVNAEIEITPEMIAALAWMHQGSHADSGATRFTVLEKGEGFMPWSYYRISAKLLVRDFVTTSNCGLTVARCYRFHGNHPLDDVLKKEIYQVKVMSTPVRLDLTSRRNTYTYADNLSSAPVPITLDHPTRSFTVGGQTVTGAVIREGEQVRVSWNPLQVPPNAKFVLAKYDRDHDAWRHLGGFFLNKRGSVRLMLDYGAGYLRHGEYQIMSMIGSNRYSNPLYVKVEAATSPSQIPRYDIRLTDLRLDPGRADRHAFLLTLTARSLGGRSEGLSEVPMDFMIMDDSGRIDGSFRKRISLPGGSEPTRIIIPIPEASCFNPPVTTIPPKIASVHVTVTLLGSDLWEERSIDRELTVPVEYRSNLAFQETHPIVVRQAGNIVIVFANLRLDIKGMTHCGFVPIQLQISTPDGTVIHTQDMTVDPQTRQVTFTGLPTVSELLGRAGGASNLTFKVRLDPNNSWAERDETDNMRRISQTLHR